MKNKVWLFTAALLLFTAGCGEPDMAQNKIVTDENLMESAKHGTDSYPFKCYFEKLSQFDFHCIDWHWHTEWEFVYVESGKRSRCSSRRAGKISM